MEVWHKKSKSTLQDKRLEERHEKNMNRRIRWVPASTFFDHNNVKKIESIKQGCNAFTHVAPP